MICLMFRRYLLGLAWLDTELITIHNFIFNAISCFTKGFACVTNLGVIWLDSHNFLLWSHGRLLSMKSLVRVLPATAYTFKMVPIYDPGGPNPHGRVWETFPVPVRDFTPRSHYPREAGLPKPDFRSRTLIRRRTHSELGYLPIRLKSTRSYSLNQSVHY